MEQNNVKSFVIIGDSVGSSYKTRINVNKYPRYLADRMGLRFCPHDYSGSFTTLMIQILRRDREVMEDVRNAGAVMISTGGTGLYLNILPAISIALGMQMHDLGNMMVLDTGFKVDPLKAVGVPEALNSPELKVTLEEHKNRFVREFPAIIKAIRALNPNAVIIPQTFHNELALLGKLRTMFISEFMKYLDGLIAEMIGVIRSCADERYVVAEFADYFKSYKGKEPITYFNDGTNKFGTHFTAAGHYYFYECTYKDIIARFPEFSHEEPENMVRTPETMTEDDKAVQNAKETAQRKYLAAFIAKKTLPLPLPNDAPEAQKAVVNRLYGMNVNRQNFVRIYSMRLICGADFDPTSLKTNDSVFILCDNGEMNVFNVDNERIGTLEKSDGFEGLLADYNDYQYDNILSVAYNDGGKIVIVSAAYGPREYFF